MSGKANKKPDVDGYCWEDFAAFLRDNAHRLTLPRQQVFEHAAARRDHFVADQIATELLTVRPKVSRGTVYNTLALMVKAGMLRQIRDSDTHTHYEFIRELKQHEHMVCDKCGSFIEFVAENLPAPIKKSCAQHNFKMRAYRLVVSGLCRNCRD